ncbi:MAG: arginyltransferase [Alphaproteobacteria bacterium]|nr:arginyltransferase [Alphaproteobacteria bacterium]
MTEGRVHTAGTTTPWDEGPLARVFATPNMACPYLPDRIERQVVMLLAGEGAQGLHDRLTRQGFRRSYNIAYRPACPGCDSCAPVRLRVFDFAPGRTLRRQMAGLGELSAKKVSARMNEEHYLLFHRYQKARHAGGAMADMELDEYRTMVEDSPVDTHLVEFRGRDETLLGVALTDQVADGLSMVYSFYDPDRVTDSPGTLMILWHVVQARRLALPFLYLGYWVAGSPKMAYKARFRPLEALEATGWCPLDPVAPIAVSGVEGL